MKMQRALLVTDVNPYSLTKKINSCMGQTFLETFPELTSEYFKQYKVRSVISITYFEQGAQAVIVFEGTA